MISVLDSRRECLQAGFHCGQILLPGAQTVVKLLPLLLPKRAMSAVAKHMHKKYTSAWETRNKNIDFHYIVMDELLIQLIPFNL